MKCTQCGKNIASSTTLKMLCKECLEIANAGEISFSPEPPPQVVPDTQATEPPKTTASTVQVQSIPRKTQRTTPKKRIPIFFKSLMRKRTNENLSTEIGEAENWFLLYTKLPTIIPIILAAIFLIFSVVDVTTLVVEYDSVIYYGSMRIPSLFLALFLWWLYGAIVCIITWIYLKISVSYKILKLDYLDAINSKLNKKEDN